MTSLTTLTRQLNETQPTESINQELLTLHRTLSRVLANAYVLKTKMQSIHWNAKGPLFYSLHILTDEQIKIVDELIDKVAERLAALGVVIDASLSNFIRSASLMDTMESLDTKHRVEQIIGDLSVSATEAKQTIEVAESMGDAASADLLTQVVFTYEHAAWLFKSTISDEV